MIAISVCFLVNWAMAATQPLLVALMLNTADALSKPWTLLTYPFALPGAAIWTAVFGTLWLWMVGTTVERDIGAGPYLGSFFGFALLGGALIQAGSIASGPYLLTGSVIPVGCITMMWGARNRNQIVKLCGLVPVSAAVLCGLTALFAFLGMGLGTPLMGLLGVLPMALAWFWAADQLPVRYPVASKVTDGQRRSAAERKREREHFNQYIGTVREREMERKEKDRLRELFERSLIEDPDDREKRG